MDIPTCTQQHAECAVSLYLMAHELSASAMLSIQLLGYKGIHLLAVRGWNAIPHLWGAVVQVVHTVQIHVLSVPVSAMHAVSVNV